MFLKRDNSCLTNISDIETRSANKIKNNLPGQADQIADNNLITGLELTKRNSSFPNLNLPNAYSNNFLEGQCLQTHNLTKQKCPLNNETEKYDISIKSSKRGRKKKEKNNNKDLISSSSNNTSKSCFLSKNGSVKKLTPESPTSAYHNLHYDLNINKNGSLGVIDQNCFLGIKRNHSNDFLDSLEKSVEQNTLDINLYNNSKSVSQYEDDDDLFMKELTSCGNKANIIKNIESKCNNKSKSIFDIDGFDLLYYNSLNKKELKGKEGKLTSNNLKLNEKSVKRQRKTSNESPISNNSKNNIFSTFKTRRLSFANNSNSTKNSKRSACRKPSISEKSKSNKSSIQLRESKVRLPSSSFPNLTSNNNSSNCESRRGSQNDYEGSLSNLNCSLNDRDVKRSDISKNDKVYRFQEYLNQKGCKIAKNLNKKVDKRNAYQPQNLVFYLYKDKKLEPKPEEKTRSPCNCKNTKCIKLYCECFRNGKYCFDCDCVNCFNIPEYQDVRAKAIEHIERKNKQEIGEIVNRKDSKVAKGCGCKNSSCLKNYCECYQIGNGCGEHCRCIDCKNTISFIKKTNSRKKLNNYSKTSHKVNS